MNGAQTSPRVDLEHPHFVEIDNDLSIWAGLPIAPSEESLRLWQIFTRNRSDIDALFSEYGAQKPMLFGSVARGKQPLTAISISWFS